MIGINISNPQYDIHVCVGQRTIATVNGAGKIEIDGMLPSEIYAEALRLVLQALWDLRKPKGMTILASGSLGLAAIMEQA